MQQCYKGKILAVINLGSTTSCWKRIATYYNTLFYLKWDKDVNNKQDKMVIYRTSFDPQEFSAWGTQGPLIANELLPLVLKNFPLENFTALKITSWLPLTTGWEEPTPTELGVIDQ